MDDNDIDKILAKHLACHNGINSLLDEQRDLIRQIREQTAKINFLAIGGRIRGKKFMVKGDE